MSSYSRVALGIALYLGMLATLLYVFTALGLNILSGGPAWLFIPMVAAGISALRVGTWWLPTVNRIVERTRT